MPANKQLQRTSDALLALAAELRVSTDRGKEPRMIEWWRVGLCVALGSALGFTGGSLRSQDRSVAVPEMKILLENARVRVQYHDVAVGETVPMHSHPAYVAYVIKPYRAKLRLADGSERLVDRKPGDVFWGDPVAHSVENRGDNEIHT